MNNAPQLSFGLMSGLVAVEPYAVGDVVVKNGGRRAVVTHMDSNDDGVVLVCTYLDTGTDGVILEREIAWRSR